MKKLIAILMVLVVLVGAVFADPDTTANIDSASETHSLKVQAAVYGTLPAFGLKVTKVNGEAFANGNITNGNKAEFIDGGDYSTTPTDQVLSATDDGQDSTGTLAASVFTLDRAGSITVSAIVQNAAKVLKVYQISFFGGQFTEILRDGKTGSQNYGVYNPSSIAAAVKTGTGFTTTAGDPSSATISDIADDAWVPANDAVSVDVEFTLTAVTPGTPVAECTFTYTGDDDINPGDYYANIGMIVTSY